MYLLHHTDNLQQPAVTSVDSDKYNKDTLFYNTFIYHDG